MNGVVSNAAANEATAFTIAGTKLFVSAETLLTEDHYVKLLQ